LISNEDIEIPYTPVSVYQAIYQRRMTTHFTEDPVSRDALGRIFDAANWGPNHRLTKPERFFVFLDNSDLRDEVATLAWEEKYSSVNNPNPDQKKKSSDDAKNRVLTAPALVYVFSVPGDEEAISRENYAAVCCAVQNAALAAVAEGLALTWSTGSATTHPRLREILGADSNWEMVGAMFIGKPDVLPNSYRTDSSERIFWLD
jgi:nitroreductase